MAAAPHRMSASRIELQPPPDDGVARLRVPPHSSEAEQSVLGALLQDNAALQVASQLLTTTDFYRFEHRLIYAAITDLIEDGLLADVVTVYQRLEANGKEADCGGLAYINDLAQCVPSASGMGSYAKIVRERSLLRKIIATADELATAAFAPQDRAAVEILEEGFSKFRAVAAEAPGMRSMPLLAYEELRQHAQAVSWLVKGAVQSDAVGMLFGASGTFKTYVALDLALHVAHGLKWLGRRTKQGPALIIAAEGGSGVFQRMEAWHRARRLRPPGPDVLRVLPMPVDLLRDAWRVADAAQAAGIKPALVMVDTMSQTFSGEENSAPEVSAYLRELSLRLRTPWKCTVLVIHHSGHNQTERPRGSSALQANTSFLIGAYRDEKEHLATISSVHQKEGAGFSDCTFKLSSQLLGTDEDGDEVTQLVARHLSSAEEVQDAMAAEHKAGRGGHNRLIVSLAHSGMRESELRKAFNDECGVDGDEARRKAYYRARKWGMEKGFFEVALDGGKSVVIALKPAGGAA